MRVKGDGLSLTKDMEITGIFVSFVQVVYSVHLVHFVQQPTTDNQA